MKGLRVELGAGPAFLAALLFFLLREEELAALLLAAAAHELGHLAAILGLGLRLREIRAELGGLRMEYSGDTGTAGHLGIAAAGPAAGFLYAWTAARLALRLGWGWLSLSAGLSLLLSLFNLLPVLPLDGGRIALYLSTAAMGEERGELLCRRLGLWLSAALSALGLRLLVRGRGAALLTAGLVLLFGSCKKAENTVQ